MKAIEIILDFLFNCSSQVCRPYADTSYYLILCLLEASAETTQNKTVADKEIYD